MKKRVAGFDLARAYAIFGMFIVNFNFCFGSFGDKTALGQFLNIFTGNSTAIFIVCAGMGVSLMTGTGSGASATERQRMKAVVAKRSWFLFGLGLSLYNWWPGDILHFYGAYMHIAALLLYVHRRYLLLGAALAIIGFHLWLFLVPVWTSWDARTFKYEDFWTVKGFLRNTFYNGWNSVFPWIGYFFLGMWLGRSDWQDAKKRRRIFRVALLFFVAFEGVRKYALYKQFNRKILDYIMFDYFPPYLPFMAITASFAVMVITTCIWLGESHPNNRIVAWLAATGRLTLTNYVFHLTIGVLVFEALTGKKYTGLLQTGAPASPAYILTFSCVFFVATVILSVLWSKRFAKGPLETVMRNMTD